MKLFDEELGKIYIRTWWYPERLGNGYLYFIELRMRDFARLCLGYIHSWQDLMEYAKRRALYHPRQGWVESESSIKIMLHAAWIET